ncbi:MAG: HAMP domain-containing protein [Deltaproteobacteria bacterium]|nr:HAMP domain-containing protein [Deltaproteobacteria bacterium]
MKTNFFKSPLLWKIYSIFVIIILCSAVIVGGLTGALIKRKTLEEVQENLQVRATLLCELAAQQLSPDNYIQLQQEIRELGQKTATRLTIIDPTGKVLADSENNPAEMDNHSNRPEVKAALLYAYGVSTRFSDTVKTQMMYLAQAVRLHQRLKAYARVSLPLTVIDQRIAESRMIIMLAIAVVALLTLLFAFFLAQHFIRPLLYMTSMAEAMAAGDFSRRLHLKRQDEIGHLAKTFNLMAEKSQQRIATINLDRSKLNAIFAAMSEGVIAVDREEKVIHINVAAASLLGTEPGRSLGKPIWEITRLQELNRILADASRAADEVKRSMKISFGLRERIIEMHAVPLKDSANRVVGAMVVLLDVSELRHLETVRRDFVTNASHELKTPITAIRALVETLIEDFGRMPAEIQLSFLKKINNQSLRLTALIIDLMALSRFELQDDWSVKVPVNLGRTIENSYLSLLPMAEEKNLQIEISRPQTEIEILSDEESLDQAVTNLLDNAIKYTPDGGHIWLRLREANGEAVIEVEDTGIGIEPDDKARIFERFYRVDKARSRELGGTGLGLAIVRHIVLAHKGRIEVDSLPGSGSTFRIYLPMTKVKPDSAEI